MCAKPLVSVILQSAYPNMSGLTRRVGLSAADCIAKKTVLQDMAALGWKHVEMQQS